MKIVVGITCRQNSRRFPEKAMAPVDIKDDGITPIPSFEYCYNRCNQRFDSYILTSKKSNKIIDHCEKNNIKYLAFKYERNVINRFFSLAIRTGAHYIVRVTADDIFFDGTNCGMMINYAIRHDLDYVYATHHVKGTECEIFKAEKLIEVYNTLDKDQKKNSEYLSWFFRNIPGIKQDSYAFGEEYDAKIKVELDTVNDYYLRVLPLIYASKRDKFGIRSQTIREYFEENPELQEDS